MTGDEQGYNGWANWVTWNVALWISNDEGLHDIAIECGTYAGYVEYLRSLSDEAGTLPISYETPDGAAWNDSGIDTEALDRMIAELSE